MLCGLFTLTAHSKGRKGANFPHFWILKILDFDPLYVAIFYFERPQHVVEKFANSVSRVVRDEKPAQSTLRGLRIGLF